MTPKTCPTGHLNNLLTGVTNHSLSMQGSFCIARPWIQTGPPRFAHPPNRPPAQPSPQIHAADGFEIHFAPPKKSWNDDSSANTNKQWFQPWFPFVVQTDNARPSAVAPPPAGSSHSPAAAGTARVALAVPEQGLRDLARADGAPPSETKKKSRTRKDGQEEHRARHVFVGPPKNVKQSRRLFWGKTKCPRSSTPELLFGSLLWMGKACWARELVQLVPRWHGNRSLRAPRPGSSDFRGMVERHSHTGKRRKRLGPFVFKASAFCAGLRSPAKSF